MTFSVDLNMCGKLHIGDVQRTTACSKLYQDTL